MNKDHSHSWVRNSTGLNRLVTDLIDKEYDDNEQETSEMKTEVFAFASRSEAKAKPQRHFLSVHPKNCHLLERTWIDIKPGAQSNLAYPVAKRLNTPVRHGQLPREEDGTMEFWRLKRFSSERF